MDKIYGTGKRSISLPSEIMIPEINDEKLRELYQLLKPIISIEEIKYFIREFSINELRYLTYLINREDNKTKRIEINDLEPIEDFLCLHSIGNFGLFQPTIAQILSQTPRKSIEEANAFEIVEYPMTESDINKYPELNKKGFHLSKVRSYKVKK